MSVLVGVGVVVCWLALAAVAASVAIAHLREYALERFTRLMAGFDRALAPLDDEDTDPDYVDWHDHSI